MTRLRQLLLLTALLAGARQAAGQDLADLFDPAHKPRFEICAYWWAAAFDGEIGFPKTLAGEGNSLDLRDDLNYGPNVNAPVGQLHIGLGRRWRFYFQYWQMGQSETVTSDRTLLFDQATFETGERLDTDLTLRSATAAVEYLMLGIERLEIHFRAGLNLSWVNQEISGPVSNGTFSTLQTFPVLGLGIKYRFSSRISTSIRGLAFVNRSLNLDETLLMGNGELGVRVLGTAKVLVGYQVYYLSAKDDSREVNFYLAGPYLGASVSF